MEAPLTTNILCLSGSITPHYCRGKLYGAWLRINKAWKSLPAQLIADSSHTIPLGVMGGKALVAYIGSDITAAPNLYNLQLTYPNAKSIGQQDSDDIIMWVDNGRLRRESQFVGRLYVPKRVLTMLPDYDMEDRAKPMRARLLPDGAILLHVDLP